MILVDYDAGTEYRNHQIKRLEFLIYRIKDGATERHIRCSPRVLVEPIVLLLRKVAFLLNLRCCFHTVSI